MTTEWWKKAVVYQIYPRSFQDSNGDGIGDLQGIIQRLDYLKNLGVDALWLSPVYASPNYDNGYDIADYLAIHPEYGTMEDMKQLIAEAHQRGIRLIMDLVVNHTSSFHPWFVEAKKNPASPYYEYYVWQKGEPTTPPNDLTSIFGGSAWEYVEECQAYYLHLFAKEQADLNWKNPALREEIYQMMNTWLDLGIDGFRMDVIDLIGKEPEQGITANGPKLHTYLKEMHEQTLAGRDVMTVGETWGATPEIAKQYSSPKEKELSMVFQFEHMELDQEKGKSKWHYKTLDFCELKAVLDKWQLALAEDGWNSLFWNNHDLPRIVSRFGSEQERVKSAKMLATLLHLLKGTPYIYQGEELALVNTPVSSIAEINDVESRNFYKEYLPLWGEEACLAAINHKGRDNARRPMPWNAEANGGFTSGTPWLALNEEYTRWNAEQALADPQSVYYYYQALIRLRHENELVVAGDFCDLLPTHPQVYAYTRSYQGERWLILANFSAKRAQLDLEVPVQEIILSNDEASNLDIHTLNPYEAVVYRCKN